VNLPFAWIALGVGLVLALVLAGSGALPGAGERTLPLLTQLIIAEFGFFVTAIGAVTAVRTLLSQGFSVAPASAVSGCVVMAAGFLWLGLQLWPDAAA